jgi:hypothetical protein
MKIGCPSFERSLLEGWEPGISTDPVPKQPSKPESVSSNDGTRELLISGASMLGAGLLAALLLVTVLGGFTATGARTNTGWFALILALMCIPFGGLLLALGVAKWLRNRRLRHGR